MFVSKHITKILSFVIYSLVLTNTALVIAQRVSLVDNVGTVNLTGVTVSSSTPSSPIMGDLWQDTGNTDFKEVLKVYDGTNWIIINNSENIYIRDNTVDIDGDNVKDTNVTLQDYVTNQNDLVNIDEFPSIITNSITLSASELENYDLFYVKNSASITLSNINIRGKIIRIVEQGDVTGFNSDIGVFNASSTLILIVNQSGDKGYETASFIWNGLKWLPFR